MTNPVSSQPGIARDNADIIYDLTRVLFRPRVVRASLSAAEVAQMDDPEWRARRVDDGANAAGQGRAYGLAKQDVQILLDLFRKERINPTALAVSLHQKSVL